MIEIQSIFKNKTLDTEKLIEYGFALTENCFSKDFPVMNGEYSARIEIDADEVVEVIMNLSDIERVRLAAPQAIVIASHLDSVNHALLTREDIYKFANERGLSGIRIPEDGECIVL